MDELLEDVMSLLRVDASIRTEGSVTREVADTVERAYVAQQADAVVVRRDLGHDPLAADTWANAVGGSRTPEAERTEAQRAAVAVAATLADEMLAADAVVVGAPLYNFGVPAHLKAWVDVLITDARFAPGTTPLAGRSVVLVVSRGGGYGPGTPREGWDHASGWLVRILADVWGGDVTLVEAELTLADVVPAMADLRPLAADNRARAHETAETAGKALARA